MVSCVLPTRNRAAFIGMAIESYQSQTYPVRELIVLDNGDDETESLIPADSSIRYVKICGQKNTGQMRNACNELARGEIICHFDSDDWSAPERIADQVQRLAESGCPVTGYHSLLFCDASGRGYEFRAQPNRYVCGTTLCYLKSWWAGHRFPPICKGEDTAFVRDAAHFRRTAKGLARALISAEVRGMMVARVHDSNTSPKD